MDRRTERLFALCRAAAARTRLVITGHDHADADAAISCVLMQELLARAGIPAQIVLTRTDTQVRRVLARFGIGVDALSGEIRATDALVLCDHHRPEHAGEVVACVDHHPTDFPPDYPYTQIEASGACALMVLRLFEAAGYEPGKRCTEMAVTALYLDTVALRSAKLPPAEGDWARETAARLHMDGAWLLREGLNLRDMSLPASELARSGEKRYDFGGRTVISTYVQTDAMTPGTLDAILAEARAALAESGAALWVFLHHDPVAGFTVEYDLWPDGRTETVRYDFVASRGKNVMPCVERMMRGMDDGTASGGAAGRD